MTIASDISRVDSVGDGVNDTFAFTFEIYTKTDILVYVGGVLKTVDVHYTVPIAGIENPDGGNVVFTVGNKPGDGVIVSIILNLPLTQAIDYVEADKFPAETHERGLDRAVKLIQTLKEESSRSLKFATSSLFKDVDIPDIESGKYLAGSAGGDGLVWGESFPTDYAIPWVDVRAYDSINAAVAAIGILETTLVIPDEQTLTDDLTIPKTLNLHILKGGSIAVPVTMALTPYSPDNIIAQPNQQIFSGNGMVSFTNGGTVYPEWWGVDGTADQVEIQKACDAAATMSNDGKVQLLGKTYNATAPLALTSTHNGLTIAGMGRKVTIIDGATAAIYGITINGVIGLNLQEFEITRCNTGAINFTGGTSGNLRFQDLHILLNGIGLNIDSTIVHFTVENSYFRYNTGNGVTLTATGVMTSTRFIACRFEVNSGSAWDASARGGAGQAHSGTFYGCVFESNKGAKTIDLSDNARGYIFDDCHFENNGAGNTTAYDIYVNTAYRTLRIKNCVFSYLHTDVNVAAYSIYIAITGEGGSITDCHFAPTRAGYLALYTSTGLSTGILEFRNNCYQDESGNFVSIASPFTTYQGVAGVTSPDGFIADNCYGFVTTTDATVTPIWQLRFYPDDVALYITADVLAVATDGSERAAYSRKVLVYHATGGDPTIQGIDDETTIESDANYNCAFAVSADNSGTIYLNVTGVAAETVKWIASVKTIAKKWTN